MAIDTPSVGNAAVVATGDTNNSASNNTNTAAVEMISRPNLQKKPKEKFEGETPDMNGHVFQTYSESQDKRQFTKTMEALQHYVNKHCKFPRDMADLFQLKTPTVTEPADISSSDANNKLKIFKWTEKAKAYLKHDQALKDNFRDIYSVIWGQCSLSLQAKIKLGKDFVEKDNNKDCAWLLKEVKNAIYKFDSSRDIFYSIAEARSNLEYLKQNKESEDEFYDMFRNHIEAFEIFGGDIGNDRGLIEEITDASDPNNPGPMPTDSSGTVDELKTWIKDTNKYKEEVRKKVRERYLAMMFLKRLTERSTVVYGPALKITITEGRSSIQRPLVRRTA